MHIHQASPREPWSNYFLTTTSVVGARLGLFSTLGPQLTLHKNFTAADSTPAQHHCCGRKAEEAFQISSRAVLQDAWAGLTPHCYKRARGRCSCSPSSFSTAHGFVRTLHEPSRHSTVTEKPTKKPGGRGGGKASFFLLLQHWATRLHPKRSEAESKLIPSTLGFRSQCFPYFTDPQEVILNTELEVTSHSAFPARLQSRRPSFICPFSGQKQHLNLGSHKVGWEAHGCSYHWELPAHSYSTNVTYWAVPVSLHLHLFTHEYWEAQK